MTYRQESKPDHKNDTTHPFEVPAYPLANIAGSLNCHRDISNDRLEDFEGFAQDPGIRDLVGRWLTALNHAEAAGEALEDLHPDVIAATSKGGYHSLESIFSMYIQMMLYAMPTNADQDEIEYLVGLWKKAETSEKRKELPPILIEMMDGEEGLDQLTIYDIEKFKSGSKVTQRLYLLQRVLFESNATSTILTRPVETGCTAWWTSCSRRVGDGLLVPVESWSLRT
ncbi:hypothetical protein B7463_g6758, partial [Scytalidium lignicola]